MSVLKMCEVCGGRVGLTDKEGFGYCENCGIVYFLKRKQEEQTIRREPMVPERMVAPEAGRREERPQETAQEEAGKSTQPTYVHWKCPDCEVEMTAANESDIEFLKREHIREYHPNRSLS